MTDKKGVSKLQFQFDVSRLASIDREFGEKLQENPKEAIKQAYGTAFSDEFEVNLVEEKANQLTIIVPSAELSDAELDSVSGGGGFTTMAIGEEGDDCDPDPTTLALGEEGGGGDGPTTLAIGEEG